MYIKKSKKPPINCKTNYCDKEKCCESIEWSIGYIIGKTVTLFMNICIHFMNNTNKGYERSNHKKKQYR